MQSIIYCPVCGSNIRFRKKCSGCGYIPAEDYEIYPTLGMIRRNTASVPVKRQVYDKRRMRQALDEMLQPIHSRLEERTEKAEKAAELMRQELTLVKEEARQAKQETEELKQIILRMKTDGASFSRTSSTEKASSPHHKLITISNSTCTFGSYPQDAQGTVQPILWRVLEVDRTNHKALLLSDKILDCRPYYASYETMDWEKAGNDRKGLRYWLNHEFFRKAFPSEREQNAILLTNVEPHANPNPKSQDDQGKAILDKIFLLSAREVIRYFAGSRLQMLGTYAKVGDLRAAAFGTLYAKKNTKLYMESNGKSRWWLRSVGNFGYSAVLVRHDGDIDLHGISVVTDTAGVRPALWVDLKA